MIDAEINIAIVELEYPDADRALDKDFIKACNVDYCNNWADIGPIIERENMFIAPIFDGWEASSIDCETPVRAETPTKAAALCYLKMKGE